MLKSWKDMRKVDVRPYVQKRDGMEYLNWAKCIDLLYANGAEKVWFKPLDNPATGNPLRETETEFVDKNGNTNKGYFVKIEVQIDDKQFEFESPVTNGNNPVKDNSMTQSRIWASITRAFVKAVAIYTGLGFDLWAREEYVSDVMDAVPDQLLDTASPAKIKTLKNKGAQYGLNLDLWIMQVGKTWDTLTNTDVSQMLQAINAKYGN